MVFMKIIYLANARIPTEKAHGIQIMKMCQAFQGVGADIELVVAKRINLEFKDTDVFDYYNISEKFPIKRLPLFDLVDRKRSLKGLSVIIQNTTFALSAFFYLLFKKVDIIYARDEFSLFFLSFFKNNLVLELHNFPRSRFFLYKWLFKKVKKIVVINNKLKEMTVDLGIDPDKILVAHDGVDLNQFTVIETKEECRRKLGLPLDKKLVIYTGQLFKWKGVYVLAEASRFLDDSYQIVLVGGMEYDRIKLEKFIKEKQLDKIIIIDHQSPDLVPYYLKSADVLILPNSSRERISRLFTSPMKMFEYMASGRPIVASNLPSIREVLNERNSILFKPDDPRDLADKIQIALDDQKVSEKALLDVQKYTWHKRVKKILER